MAKADDGALKDLFKGLEKEINIFFKPELIQTGIVPLDLVLNGGLETGSLIELSGESQTGKSTLLLHLSKNLCDKGYKVVYIDSEGSVKEDLLNGVGLAKYVCTPDNIDNNFVVIRESGYNKVEDLIKKFLTVGGFKLIILDSLTALSPDIYLDLDKNRMGTEDRVGYEAQLNGRLLKQLNSLKTKYNCIFMFINQTRIDMSGWKPQYKSSGGQAVKFLPDVRLFMKLKEKLIRKEDALIGEVERPYGANTTIEAHKSRLGAGFLPYNLQIQFGRGCSNLTAYADLLPNIMVKDSTGKEVPMLEKKSSVSYVLHLKSGDVSTTRGQAAMLEMLKDNYEVVESQVQEFLLDYYQKLKSTPSEEEEVHDGVEAVKEDKKD